MDYDNYDLDDSKPTRKGARAVFYLVLVLVLAGAGFYVYATNYHGFRDVVISVRESVDPADEPADAPVESPDLTSDPTVEGLTRRIADLELRSTVRDALARHSELGGADLRVTVEDAVVKLSGTVPASGWIYAAERLAGEVEGVERIDNAISVDASEAAAETADPNDADRRLARLVEFELYATEAFDLDGLEITAADGEVRLGGHVRSLAERLLAERVAGETEGVTAVTNDLEVAATTASP